jgi:hypothetical protein
MHYSRAEWLLIALIFGISVAANLPAEFQMVGQMPPIVLQLMLLVLLTFVLVRYVPLSIVIAISILVVGSGTSGLLADYFQVEHWGFLAITGLMLLLSLAIHLFDWSAQDTVAESAGTQSVQTLFRAVEQGNLAWTYRLLAMGADINVRNETGQTPLMRAAAKGYADMVQVLIQNGANPRLENNRGESAMTIALMKGYTRTAESLKMAEASHRAERREQRGSA